MRQTVYTASPESQQIHVWSPEPRRTLTLVQVVDIARSGSADGGQSDKRYLYVVRPGFVSRRIVLRRMMAR